MSPSNPSPSARDASPEAIRRALSDAARRELDRLRADLERKLAALEAALAHPDRHDSLEPLVIDLARTATLEAESAAAQAALDAQVRADEKAGGRATEDARELDAARSANAALRRELEDARGALEQERRACAERDRDLDERRAKLVALEAAHTQERSAGAEAAGALRRDLETMRGARDIDRKTLEAERKASAQLQRTVEELQGSLESERTAREGDRRATAQQERSATELRAAFDREREAGAARDRELGQARAHAAKLEAEIGQTRAERDAAMVERDASRAERDRAIAARDIAIFERDASRADRARTIAERERDVQHVRAQAATLDADLTTAHARIRELESHLLAASNPVSSATEPRTAPAVASAADAHSTSPAPEDIDMASLIDSAPAPGAPPVRSASRYRFAKEIPITINQQDEGALVDLSISGAQILAAKALHEGKVATITLTSDEIPVTCTGTIVWSQLDPQSQKRQLRYRAGMMFTDADQASLEAFIIRYAST